jgi:hypothetical protein
MKLTLLDLSIVENISQSVMNDIAIALQWLIPDHVLLQAPVFVQLRQLSESRGNHVVKIMAELTHMDNVTNYTFNGVVSNNSSGRSATGEVWKGSSPFSAHFSSCSVSSPSLEDQLQDLRFSGLKLTPDNSFPCIPWPGEDLSYTHGIAATDLVPTFQSLDHVFPDLHQYWNEDMGNLSQDDASRNRPFLQHLWAPTEQYDKGLALDEQADGTINALDPLHKTAANR